MWKIISHLVTVKYKKDFNKAKKNYTVNDTKIDTDKIKQYRKYAINIIEKYIENYIKYLNDFDKCYKSRIKITTNIDINLKLKKISSVTDNKMDKISLYDKKSVYGLPPNFKYYNYNENI